VGSNGRRSRRCEQRACPSNSRSSSALEAISSSGGGRNSAPPPRPASIECRRPYYVNTDLPEPILTRDETLAQLKERGLPIELLQHLQRATAPLDSDEDTDPYRSPQTGETIDVTPKKD
jgi:hypothetical protein